jgi:DUF3102 family protein
MTREMTVSDNKVAHSGSNLALLAERANRAHEQVGDAARDAVDYACEAGHALLEAKRHCQRGLWTAWLAAHFHGSARTAQGYMRLATYRKHLEGDPQRAADLSRRQLDKLLTGLSYSDGRDNPVRSARPQKTANAAAALAATGDAQRPAVKPPAQDPDPLDPFGRLLRQAIAELQRLIELRQGCVSYARHLLWLLERILDGLTTYRWHWDDLIPPKFDK